MATTVYDITLKAGITYAPHQCFARDGRGRLKYHNLPENLPEVTQLHDLPDTGTRELVAADYVTQLKRLADPTLVPGCPILPVMAKYIVGLGEYARLLRKDLEDERAHRREAGGPLYNAELDERRRPIRLDLDRHPLPGVRVLDRHTYRITIKGQYPQILYWLAMPFFAPMPAEALIFYGQSALIARSITLNRYPIGTGPYRIELYNPHREIILARNELYHGQTYPRRGEPGDRQQGLLEDAGRGLPFFDRIVLKLEKEAIPRWLKFVQGYYDASGIPSESFDQAVQFSPEGTAEISPDFTERGIRLEVGVNPTTYYFAFNMLDDTVGGYTEPRAKLRQAIAIAINSEERVQIFLNGRGVPAQSLIPPGIYGYELNRHGMDPFVYRWDERAGRPVRRSLEHARMLLAEAGYPQGRDDNGRQLEIRFANPWKNPSDAIRIQWLMMKLEAIGVKLKNETTDYNRFRDKAAHGNFQMLHWGWHADYPDPENFLFLLYGMNGRVKHQGPNTSNYDNPEFNRLFKRLETMENSPERLDLIRQANRIAQHDAPLVWGFHPVIFTLAHDWLKNTKPSAIAYTALKYHRLDLHARDRYRLKYNRPVLWPIVVFLGLIAVLTVPAFVSIRRRARREI